MSETENTAAIEMREVSVGAMRDISFIVLEDVTWSVAAGEFWTVAGQPYSGKSDFLMLAAGLMAPVRGECRLFGTDTRTFGEAKLAERLHVGFVFAGGQLFNQLTIRENVALPLQYHHDLAPAAAARAVERLLELLELTPLADLTPVSISENWRARAALARALILKPKVLLLDNPLAGLGIRHLHWWLRFLDRLSRGHDWCDDRPMTVVVTTDDLRPWRDPSRKFALLRDKKFFLLGHWNEVEASGDALVKELLAEPMETVE
ncbi:MAG TPA: ATP-binding cassette domain-containing protein [Candidatus Sulfopaludibacter sp.]|nr:ATP-binding cassette domain-containing protein [Candidatus Sulfopaludibacter sp.]